MVATFMGTLLAQAQNAEVSVSTKLERDTILIGDQVVFSVVAKMPSIVKVKFPCVADSLGYGIDVIGKAQIDSSVSDGVTTYTMRMLITAFDSGLHVVPELFFALEHAGQVDTVHSPQRPFIVNIIPKSPDQKDICDIKPPMREPITFAEVAPWAGLGLLLIAIVVLLIIYLKKRKENKPFLKIFKPAEPAHVIALRNLNAIKEQKLWTSDNQKLYYTKLTDILRAYLEGRFGIDAQEKTSSEILGDLHNVGYNFGSRFQQLEDMLFTADLVKFAKHLPLVNENEQYLNFSIDFVNATKPEDKVEEKPLDSTTVKAEDDSKGVEPVNSSSTTSNNDN